MWSQVLMAPGCMELQEVAAPTGDDLSDGEVIVQFLCGGICGSDAPYFYGQPGSPGQAGDAGFPLHEVVGRVVETTSSTLHVGDRVVGYATAARGLCEYFANDAAQLIAVDSLLGDRELVLAQPLATVMSALSQLSTVRDAHVAVIGLRPDWHPVLPDAEGRGSSARRRDRSARPPRVSREVRSRRGHLEFEQELGPISWS